MADEKKGLLTIILGRGKAPAKKPEETESETDEGGEIDGEAMKAAGEELLKAIKDEDAEAVGKALKAAFDCCSGMEE